jgi:hypothetical protein
MPFLFPPVYSSTCLLQSFFFYYLEFVWGSAPPSLSSGVCHKTATVTSFPHYKIAGHEPSLLLSLASLFIYSSHEGVPLPHSQDLKAFCPLCYMSFFFFPAACLLFSLFFSFFPPGWGVSLCRLCWFVPGFSVGVLHATYLLTWGSANQVRSWHLVAWEPSWFLHLMWSRDAMHGLGVWRCWSFASSW